MNTENRPASRRASLTRRALASAVFALCAAAANADDSEIFINTQTLAPPNILLVLDTSGSMGSSVYSRALYDGSKTYTGSCVGSNAYVADQSNSGTPPACTAASFPIASMKCTTAVTALSGAGSPGYFSDSMVRWSRIGASAPYNYTWNYILTTATGTDIACRSDNVSGQSIPTLYTGPVNTAATEWTTWVGPPTGNANSYWESPSSPKPLYTVYSGNYLNWLYQTNPAQVYIGDRIQVVTKAAINLINSVPQNWNFGLMRYSSNGVGGMVATAVAPLTQNLSVLTTEMNSWGPGGSTPLTETLYEAYLYYAGKPIRYGLHSTPFTSTAAARVGGSATSTVYKSPITDSCQKNFIIYLTDGQPNGDADANTVASQLPTFPNPTPLALPSLKLAGGCDDPTKYPYSHSISPNLGASSASDGICGGAIAANMYNSDISDSLPGVQNVQTYYIGFGTDFSSVKNNPNLQAEFDYLSSVATRGGGKAYTATDLTSLEGVFTSIAGNILQQSASFVAPTIPVNAFNPTQTLSDVYLSLFQSAKTYHWPGNLKKFNLLNGTLVDKNGSPAVDPSTQSLRTSAQSVWSNQVDGPNVLLGGAAAQIPEWDPASGTPRTVYTYVGAAHPSSPVDLTLDTYAFKVSNSQITAAMLGANGASDAVRADIINYARGEDLWNINNNGLTTDSRKDMGDALHAVPAVVIYGGTSANPDVTDAVVYRPDNDGMLHAISAATGTELWAFIPQEALGQMQSLYSNGPLSTKHYILDGSVKVLKYDANGDGVIDTKAGDRVIIYFGQGRGGQAYYAMDVTDRTHPQLLWTLSDGLVNHGYAWGTPVIAKININGATQNSQKLVLIIGGGYDLQEENVGYVAADNTGNALYFVDALYGTVLWAASNNGADLNLARMHHAIPGDVLALDTNSDGYVDRVYAGDMAGQIWRFDITNGNSRGSLVAGGVIASLGAADGGGTGNNRRFYAAPDAALFGTQGHAPFVNIAIGSGYRGHPLDTTTTERFYSIRDYKGFAARTQSDYDSTPPVTDGQLVDITSSPTSAVVPDGSPGWKLSFTNSGEKVLSSATTFNNSILFTTYAPGGAPTSCSPSVGLNRYYAVALANGAPTLNLSNGNNQTTQDRSLQLNQAGIAPNVSILINNVTDKVANSNNTAQTPVNPSCSGDPACLINRPACGAYVGVQCVPSPTLGSRIRTYWSGNDAQ